MTNKFHSKKSNFKKSSNSDKTKNSNSSNNKNNKNSNFKKFNKHKKFEDNKFENKPNTSSTNKYNKYSKTKNNSTRNTNNDRYTHNKNLSPKEEVFKNRYNKNFGKGTFNKLLEIKRELADNSFIRVNLSKTTIQEVEEFLKKNRVTFTKTFIPNAFRIRRSFFNLSSSILALTSKIYFQDLASQVPVNLIDFNKLKKQEKTIRILDMAASPGSKTTQILDLLEHHKINYEIIALEPNKIRINRLINNIQKAGFGFDKNNNIEIINIEGEKYSSKDKFDIILLDAPCGGNLIGDSAWLKKRDIGGIEQMAALQKKLLRNAKTLLAEDGELIYSTCSLELEENEMNVAWATNKLKLEIVKKEFNFGFNALSSDFISKENTQFKQENLKYSFRLMPYVSRTQGFFVCVFKK